MWVACVGPTHGCELAPAAILWPQPSVDKTATDKVRGLARSLFGDVRIETHNKMDNDCVP
jgi:hypothetical protein